MLWSAGEEGSGMILISTFCTNIHPFFFLRMRFFFKRMNQTVYQTVMVSAKTFREHEWNICTVQMMEV